MPVYLTGDWRNQNRVEYIFQSPGLDDQLDLDTLGNMVAFGVARTLTSRQFRTYPRSRWLGFDLTLVQLGLLEATHGILSHAFRKLCALFVPKRLKADMAAASIADGSAEGEVADNADGAR